MSTILKKGIDVSYSQGNIEFDKIDKKQVQFVIIRSSYGWEQNQEDGYFERNYQGFKKIGIPCGAYHYSYATNEAEAVKEADYCHSILKNRKLELPIYYDIEDKCQKSLNRTQLTNVALAFCKRMKQLGYRVGVYTYMSWCDNNINMPTITSQGYDFWFAQYYNKPQYNGVVPIWQHSNTAKYNGIKGNVDENYMYVNVINSTTSSSTANKPNAIKPATSNSNSVVKIVNKTSYLKKYAYVDDFSNASIVTMPVGANVTWISDDNFGWSKIKYGNLTGYVQNTRLNKTGLSKYRYATVTGNSVNIRKAPRNGSVVGQVNRGNRLEVHYIIENGINEDWAEVSYNGGNYYISSKYIKMDSNIRK